MSFRNSLIERRWFPIRSNQVIFCQSQVSKAPHAINLMLVKRNFPNNGMLLIIPDLYSIELRQGNHIHPPIHKLNNRPEYLLPTIHINQIILKLLNTSQLLKGINRPLEALSLPRLYLPSLEPNRKLIVGS